MSEVSLAPGWRSAMAEEPPPSRQSARTQPSSLSSSPSSAAVRPVLTEDWLPSISYRTTVPSLLTRWRCARRREDAASMPEVVTGAVVDEQLAADGIFDLAPGQVCGGDGERDLLTDREIDPRGNVRAVGFGEYHLVFTDGEGGRAGSLAHDLELDRAAGLDRGGVFALEHDIAPLAAKWVASS